EPTRAAEGATRAAAAALGAVIDGERSARAALGSALAAFLQDGAEADFARLDAALPLVLLPVRIETRFGLGLEGAPALLIRVYPDDIAATAHDPELTLAERDLGRAYWRAVWPGDAAAADAWRALLAASPAPRAAFIVRATTPTNVAVEPR